MSTQPTNAEITKKRDRIPKPKVTHKRPNHLMVRKPVDCPSTLVRATPHNLSILTNPRSTEKLASLLLDSIPTRGDLELTRTKEIRRVISTKMRPVWMDNRSKAFNSDKQVCLSTWGVESIYNNPKNLNEIIKIREFGPKETAQKTDRRAPARNRRPPVRRWSFGKATGGRKCFDRRAPVARRKTGGQYFSAGGRRLLARIHEALS